MPARRQGAVRLLMRAASHLPVQPEYEIERRSQRNVRPRRLVVFVYNMPAADAAARHAAHSPVYAAITIPEARARGITNRRNGVRSQDARCEARRSRLPPARR